MVRESGLGVMISPPYFGYTVGSTPSAYASMGILKGEVRTRNASSGFLVTTDSSEWMNPSAPVHARA